MIELWNIGQASGYGGKREIMSSVTDKEISVTLGKLLEHIFGHLLLRRRVRTTGRLGNHYCLGDD